jgi:hypothetical protein
MSEAQCPARAGSAIAIESDECPLIERQSGDPAAYLSEGSYHDMGIGVVRHLGRAAGRSPALHARSCIPRADLS